jgi:RecJ-like exonuclease
MFDPADSPNPELHANVCRRCGGEGWVNDNDCSACNGTGDPRLFNECDSCGKKKPLEEVENGFLCSSCAHPDPRGRGDDDGVEYGHPQDALHERLL